MNRLLFFGGGGGRRRRAQATSLSEHGEDAAWPFPPPLYFTPQLLFDNNQDLLSETHWLVWCANLPQAAAALTSCVCVCPYRFLMTTKYLDLLPEAG